MVCATVQQLSGDRAPATPRLLRAATTTTAQTPPAAPLLPHRGRQLQFGGRGGGRGGAWVCAGEKQRDVIVGVARQDVQRGLS